MHHKTELYQATLAPNSTIPTLLCGHCKSMLSPARIVTADNDNFPDDVACCTIGLCSADDCRAVNCCDAALGAAQARNQSVRLGL